MKVEADLERCIGSGLCALTAPEIFDQDDDDGHVLLRKEEVAGDDVEAASKAVSLCPSAALSFSNGSN